MTTVPQPGALESGLSPVQKGRELLQNRTGLSRVQPCPRRGGCRASPRLRLLRRPILEPGTLLSPGVKGSPGLSPSLSPLPRRCPVGQLLLGSSSGPYWGPPAGAFCPSRLPEGGDRAWAGEAPKGLFPQGRRTRARQAPSVEPSGRADGRARERTRSGSRRALGSGTTREPSAEGAVGARGQGTGRRSAPRPPSGAHALQAAGLGPRGPGACWGPAWGLGPSCRR